MADEIVFKPDEDAVSFGADVVSFWHEGVVDGRQPSEFAPSHWT